MLVGLVLAAALSAVAAVDGESVGRVNEGRALATANCGACHAIERRGASAHRGAPPLRNLHRLYPVENLEESLAEGIFVGHPDMPPLEFDAQQVADFIAYLKSFEGRRRR